MPKRGKRTVKLVRYADLRDVLREIEPVGDDGFEGLVAEALAAFSGLTFRLARSGSQFGRDASTPLAPFAIAMEAKRYDDDLRLEDLAGKALVARFALEGKIDVWVLGATSEAGEDALAKLTEIFEKVGVTLLPFDWASRPLPPMAVLLAATRTVALDWFRLHYPRLNGHKIATELDRVAADPSFEAQLKLLRKSVNRASVGLDALRRRCREWLRTRFTDPVRSQLAFGQYITVADPTSPAETRLVLLERLGNLVVPEPTDLAVVAVVGDEGVGKTWLVAQWWLSLPDSPIMLLVSGRRADCLIPGQPLESLARLIAWQEGNSDEDAQRGWCRRLQRWKSEGADAYLRFIVVLDGANEQVGHPWADLIKELAREVRALGGLVVVTSRAAFWRREVSPRLRGALEVRELSVGGYDDDELLAVLARRNIAPSDLSPRVWEFLRNPRICRVALGLVDRLSLQPNELSVERLLIEYWQSRLQERGNLVAHNVLDFERLLRSHARAWREQPKRRFDIDEWTVHSGAAQRLGLAQVQNDITEIEEGRFLQIAPDDSTAYEFRSEVLPYALGLLINAELKDELRSGDGNPSEHLDKIIDTVRDFDLVGRVIAAAVGLACLDDTFPPAGRSALVAAWLGLQNTEDATFEEMAVYVPARPDAFLDAAELAAVGGSAHYDSLVAMLTSKRDHPVVRSALEARLAKWLGTWSWRAPNIILHSGGEGEQAKHESRINAALSSLSDRERALFRRLTVEVPDARAMELDKVAAFLIAGRPLRPFAEGLVGWALAQAIAGGPRNASEALEWVVRLNVADWAETRLAVWEATSEVDEMSSEKMRSAAAISLDLLGDQGSSKRANRLQPPGKSWRWRLVENFCNTNPHDPNAPPPTNLDNARSAANAVAPSDIWAGMGQTMPDHQLELITPALARFDPPTIVAVLRRIVATAPERTGLYLRQLSFRLIELSPLFDEQVLAAVKDAYDALLQDSNRVGSADRNWIASSIVRAMVPHLSAEGQLDLLLSLPDECPLYLNLWNGLRPLSADIFEAHLTAAVSSPWAFTRILFFGSGSKPELTEGSRGTIAAALNDPDETISSIAAQVACAAEDPELYERLLSQAASKRAVGNSYAAGLWSRAVAEAVINGHREDLIDLLPPQTLDVVAAQMGGAAIDLLADYIERVISRLLRPVSAVRPNDVTTFVEASQDGLTAMRRVEDNTERELPSVPRDIRSIFNTQSALSDPVEAARRYSERQKAMIAEMEAYEHAIVQEGVTDAFAMPPRRGLKELARRDPARVGLWVAAIADVRDPNILAQVRNLGLSLASAHATNDPEKATELFRHLKRQTPPVNVLIGDESIPFYDYALFTAADSQPITALRGETAEEALDDATLQMVCTAAEVCGATTWLDGHIERLLASDHPCAKARAITLAGFRQLNERSSQVLSEDWGGGFLGQAAAAARESYRRADWARHWLEQIAQTSDPIEFWRFATLAKDVVDVRFVMLVRRLPSNELLRSYGAALYDRLKSAAEERLKKGRETLFGIKAPGAAFISLYGMVSD